MICWDHIETVLLDMDGTLLDLYFDNFFWMELVPQRFAEANHISLDDAKTQLFARFGEHRGTLNWYCLDFWSAETGLNIVAMKEEVKDLIGLRPNAITFLEKVQQSGRKAVLVTNAHRGSLDLKLKQIPMAPHFDGIFSSHDFGLPKEDPQLWSRLQEVMHYEPARTLLIDDSLAVLRSAQQAGIAYTLGVLQPDSKQGSMDTEEFIGLDCFSSIYPPDAAGEA
ncbi:MULTISPECIES: GMP/IMP nucleotidase [unclassified Ketobacter]|jgi:5'-nucleotidase|uniref:GMP/IMP nucleotidase n=1 Tax=unclassified Ketobacter TaxID=2639109 RepID=UPI000F2942C2|nr:MULTISPECIES: GMP/IMP nucleotidase [unclassified Ketobacter]RLT90345.1 MAG: GMP/IMP nucleotidase [Ketobacter sp. GenoA1]RLT99442.1 MAG: GMP/IMP nucleotidase [Ketobacter sp.]